MSDLIKRPLTVATRPLVEAAIQRLMRYPSRDGIKLAMRLVDEYAASQHTSRVYAHADRVVAQALVEADRHAEHGRKIFVCVLPPLDGREKNFHVNNHGVYEKNFLPEHVEKYIKNFFNEASYTQARSVALDDVDHGRPPAPEVVRARTVDTSTVGAQMEQHTCHCTRPHTDDASTVNTLNVDLSSIAPWVLPPRKGDAPPVPVPADTDAPMDAPTAVQDGGTGVKLCTVCGQVLPHGSFNRNRSRPDGYTNECRTCHQARGERYRARVRHERAQQSAPTR